MANLSTDISPKKSDFTLTAGMTDKQIAVVLNDTMEHNGRPKGIYSIKRIKEGYLVAYVISAPMGNGVFELEHWNYHPMRTSLTFTHTSESSEKGFSLKAIEATMASLLRLYPQDK